jgi:hypothetical protein
MDTWGALVKSQIDSETIEEAISRLIAEHESDPEAHTGPNESLEVHRATGILDHKVGSVLSDKWTMTEFSISEDFRTVDHWEQIGDVSTSNWPALYLYVEWGATNKSEIYREIQIPQLYLSREYDQMFQVTALYDFLSNNFHSWLGIGLEDELPRYGYGFVINNGELRACIANDNVRTFSDLISIDLNVAHIYRGQVIAEEGKVYFYIDGSEVAVLDVPSTGWDTDDGPHMGIRLFDSNDGTLKVGDLFFSRSIVN